RNGGGDGEGLEEMMNGSALKQMA
ncbi:hypothetical protein A2U01_0107974, partial [Trifolium medium]|nr:hypothetical protein [Trifolium medium]